MGIAKHIFRAHRLDARQKRLLGRAIGSLVLSASVVRLLPFRRAIRFGSVPQAADKPRDSAGVIADHVWAVRAAARSLPIRAKCLQQGLALQRLLRRAGVDAILHYGIAHDPVGELTAHVWIAVGGEIILGGEERRISVAWQRIRDARGLWAFRVARPQRHRAPRAEKARLGRGRRCHRRPVRNSLP